ncbi:MAG: ABC transporter substrate-binding protein [Burkholderiaceae bacterium]
MKYARLSALRVALAAVVAAGLSSAAAVQAQIKVGVLVSATGPTAQVGIPQRNTVPLLPTRIGGLTVEYTTLDDASDTTASVTAAKKLIAEQNIDVLIGPPGTPNAMGVLPFIAEAGVPMLSPTGGAIVVLPMTEQKKWVFKTTQNDDIIAEALIGHMVKAGVKTVALFGTNDPYGENWHKVFSAMAEPKGLKVVASEKFNRTDTSATGQGLRVIASRPDAVLITAPGGPSVLPQVTLYDQGYRGRMYQTHGAALPDFLRLGGKKVEGTVLAASLMLVLPEIADGNPSKKIATDYIAAYEKINGSKPATFGANVFDAGLLLQRTVPIAAAKAKPGTREFRAALRDALENVKDLVGTQGVYNMTPEDHSGFDQRGRVLITVKDGNWTLLK